MRTAALPLLLALAAPGLAAADLAIPLEVFEAKRLAAKGMDRTNEGVVVGVPFTDAMGVKEVNSRPALALKGAKHYQFRTLAKWPSGNVRWAAVAFQTDCKAGQKATGFTVVRGKGVSEGEPLAAEGVHDPFAAEGEPLPPIEELKYVFVATGVLNAYIRKKSFNLVNHAWLEVRRFLRDRQTGITVTDTAGREFWGSSRARVLIKENGPVRCVIQATGDHRDKDGKRMLGYVVRMVFWRGSPTAKAYYTLTNDEDKENRTKVTIKSVNLVHDLGAETGSVRTTSLPQSAGFAGAHPIIYYQARPRGDFAMGSGRESMTWQELGVDPKDTGWWIKQGEKKLAGDDARTVPDLMWMDVAGRDGKGMLVGIRFARGNFPKSLKVDADGKITIGLLPEENKIGHLVAHGSHTTFEVLYHFHDKPLEDPAGVMYRFQYPLVGRCPVSWYNRCTKDDEVYPLYHFVSRKEEEALSRKMGWTNRQANRARDMVVWRTWYWGRGGFRNQHDFARIALVNFLRDDNIARAGAYFLYAEDRINYNADWSVHHGEGRTDFGRRNYIGRKINFEEEHRHWYGIPLYYYCTGDQRIGDVAREYVTKFRKDCSSARMYGWTRFFGWAMYFLAGGHDITDDERFRNGIRGHLKTVLSRKRWPMDWNRGVFGKGGVDWTKQPKGKQVVDHAPRLMNGYIIHDSFWLARTQFGWDDPTGDRLADICEGIQWYMAREQCLRKKDGLLFMPYRYNLNGKPLMLNAGYYTPGTAFYSLLLPKIRHGEEFAPNRIEDVVKASFAHGLREDGFTFLDHPGCQAALYYLIHQKDKLKGEPPAAITDLKVESLGGGKVRLTWTTPKSAAKFQARYSTKPMVPNLNFDPVKLVYGFPPETHANWWAAEHLHGEPTAKPGEKQSCVADLNKYADYKRTPFQPGTYTFGIRAWDAKNRRSAISNQVKVDVK